MDLSSIQSSVNIAMVFTEGMVSFFSPCVIALIPLYMGYLAGGAKQIDELGNTVYHRKRVILHTIFFILGISVAFFILGLGFSTLGKILKDYRDIISKLGGAIIIIFGLNQLNIFRIGFLKKELRINKKTTQKNINPILAFVMGFGFSFAWTPCVGPALASVLILASNAKSQIYGNILVLVYALGFLIPFIVLGIFTGQTLNFIKKNPKIMNTIVKIGGVILIAMGLLLMTGYLDSLEAQLGTSNKQSSQDYQSKSEVSSNTPSSSEDSKDSSSDIDKDKPKMYPIILQDQNGRLVNVEKDFKGKTVFINFFATWCPPCRQEIPDIERLYQDNGYNKDDVVVIGVASPSQGREQNEDGVKKFINDMDMTYPVLMDNTGDVFGQYGVYSLPTSFVIDKNGKVFGYITGAISRELMDKAINQAKTDI